MSSFTSVPIVDYALLQSDRDRFISDLRHALVNVGFLYLSHPPVDTKLIDAVVDYTPKFFELPQEAKDSIKMENSQHFLGYSRLGYELTRGETDQREQFDCATPLACRWREGDPQYLKLWGHSQWPPEDDLPGFRNAMEAYLQQVVNMSYEFVILMAEAFGLPKNAFEPFYDDPSIMQHRSKVVKYPAADTLSSNSTQGVGPHFDGGFLTFLLQASDHRGLQAQNVSGEWIDVPPIKHTFVINIGKGLEAVTEGIARATSHRVLTPPAGSTPRYSIPLFQNIGPNVIPSQHKLPFPPELRALTDNREDGAKTDSVNFSEYLKPVPSGQVQLIGRVKSHPDVAERHYPDLFKQFFPHGRPKQAAAY